MVAHSIVMRCFTISKSFGLENLVSIEREKPKPKASEILIKIHAVSLNYRDLLMVKGEYNPRQKLPLIPCSDAAGVVEEIGSEVSLFNVGDRVMPIFVQSWLAGNPTLQDLRKTLGGPIDGTLTEYMCVPEISALPIPEYLSMEEAATLPCAAVTAWSSLFEFSKIQAGDTVLILGTGGVSVFALQLAKLAGAIAVVTSSSDEKLKKMISMGADHTINYRESKNWAKEIRKITNNKGVDFVVEVGGAGTLEQSIRSVKPGGTIALIGILAGRSTETSLLPILMQNIKLQGIIVGSRSAFENMLKAMNAGKIKPVVDKVFPMKDSKLAFEYLESQKHIGKIVIHI